MNPRTRTSSIHDQRYRSIVSKLVRLRESAGLSQSELAAVLNMVQPDISKIERYERRLDIIEAFDWLRAVKGDDLNLLAELWQIGKGGAA